MFLTEQAKSLELIIFYAWIEYLNLKFFMNLLSIDPDEFSGVRFATGDFGLIFIL